MEVTIRVSQVWWEPFLKLVRTAKNFERFCIGSCAEYEKRVQVSVIAHQGRFFYAWIDSDEQPTAVTAVSHIEDVLHVHFYWSNSGHPESYPLFSKIFNAVYEHYNEAGFKYVLFPVPPEYLGSWHRFAEKLYDGYGRRLDWYKFRSENFAVFGKLAPKHRVKVPKQT